MNDRERISRLLGAAMSECSSSSLDEVRTLIVRAMNRLGESKDKVEAKPSAKAPPSFTGMSRDQVGSALRAIEDMIERERSKSGDEGEKVDLFG